MATHGTPKRLEQVETKGHLCFPLLTIFLPTVTESNINFVTQDKRIGALDCFTKKKINTKSKTRTPEG